MQNTIADEKYKDFGGCPGHTSDLSYKLVLFFRRIYTKEATMSLD